MLRKDILDATGLSDNTTFSNALQELEQCGFIRKFMPIGGKSKNAIYQLMDNYTLFYFDFIKKYESRRTLLDCQHGHNHTQRLGRQGI